MKKMNYYVLALALYAQAHAMDKKAPRKTPEEFIWHIKSVERCIRYESGKEKLQEYKPHELYTLLQYMIANEYKKELESNVWIRNLLEIITQQGKPEGLLKTVKKMCTDNELSVNKTAVDRILYYLAREHQVKNEWQPKVPDAIACECLEFLVKKRVVMDCDTIFDLVQADRTLLIDLLLHNGAVNANGITNVGTPLWHLARSPAMRNLLIKYGNTQINSVDKHGNTLLHCYATHSDTFGPDADHLLKIGSDINAQNVDGDTPLHIAVRRCNQEAIEWLITRGADCFIKNKAGEYALPVREYHAHTKKELIKPNVQ